MQMRLLMLFIAIVPGSFPVPSKRNLGVRVSDLPSSRVTRQYYFFFVHHTPHSHTPHILIPSCQLRPGCFRAPKTIQTPVRLNALLSLEHRGPPLIGQPAAEPGEPPLLLPQPRFSCCTFTTKRCAAIRPIRSDPAQNPVQSLLVGS
ncbi:hypothetical protein HDV57DRAFT_504852 [Trichoderma longibrachiatum]